ncbi:MAG: DUF192 domain-containing protein [Phycisphaerae bacterium]
MKARTASAATLALLPAVGSMSCAPTEPNKLDALGTVRMTIKGQQFELWIADSFDEQNKGLMFLNREDMAPLPDGTERGMLFVFAYSTRRSFWMKNTRFPLDIAYIDRNGKVVRVYTMAALDSRHNQYPPGAPYRYAIETNADVLHRLGLSKGDVLEIPKVSG